MENHDRSKRRSVIAESFVESNGVFRNSDITEDILSRIPTEFVSRTRAVCNLWKNHLNIPNKGFLFTGSYFEGSDEEESYIGDHQFRYADEEEVFNVCDFQSLAKINHGLGQNKYIRGIYGSCNGLVCFRLSVVYICNPMTGEYIYLPEMDLRGISNVSVFGGFGYSISTNEYKVVQVYYDADDVESVGRVEVYTLGGGNGWRHKGEIPYFFVEGAVSANNSLYWLEHSTAMQSKNIIAFDLADETFSILPLPPCFDIVHGYYLSKQVHLVSLRGSLGFYHVRTAEASERNSPEVDSCLDIWTLKKEMKKKKNYNKKGNKKSLGPFGYYPVDENDDSNTWVWIREFSMKYDSLAYDPTEYEPFDITPSNQILMWENQAFSNIKYLYCYDPNTLTLKKLWDKYVSDAQAIPHMNSFVSLEDLGESWSQRYVLNDCKHNMPTNSIKSKVFDGSILGTSNGLIKNLNLDITANILSRIPIECVSLGRAVCRLWRILLKKPKTGFLVAVSKSVQHSEEIQIFHGYSEEVSIHDAPICYKTLTKVDLGLGQSRNIPVKLINSGSTNLIIFGSCNGLVCLPVQKDETKRLVYICNPMTGEYAYLPEMDFGEISRPRVFGGFGYCQSTNEYKVVQVTYEYGKFKQRGRVQVYTLGSGSGWRNKGEIHYTCRERLVFANEALYWIEGIADDCNIRAFHLADETFGTVPMPTCRDVIGGYKHLVSMNGCLCVYHVTDEKEDSYYCKEDKRMDLWILKKVQKKKKKNECYFPVDENDDSNPWVWILEISMKYKTEFPDHRHYEPFSITKNNQVLMWEDHDVHDYKAPVCYDPNTASTYNLWEDYVLYAQAVPHLNSFVSLEDLGEKSAKYIPDDSKFMHRSRHVYDCRLSP